MTVHYKLHPSSTKVCCEAENRSFQVERSEHFCSMAFQQDKQTALATAATQSVAVVVFIAAIAVSFNVAGGCTALVKSSLVFHAYEKLFKELLTTEI